MRFFKSFKFFTIHLLIFGIGCGVAHAQSEDLEIITYGDSITAGFKRSFGVITCPPGVTLDVDPGLPTRDTCFGRGAEGAGGYQPTLKQSIEELGYDVLIYNYGSSGYRTDELYAAIDTPLNDRPNSDYFILLTGSNDAIVGVSTSTVQVLVQSMVNYVCQWNMIPVISTPTYNGGDFAPDPANVNNFILSYGAAIQQISTNTSSECSSRNIEVILADQYSAVNFFSDDQLHLTDIGDIEMANEWFRALALPSLILPTPPAVMPFIIGAIKLLLLEE